ncbi:hypothetical protein GCM10009854_28250 [Saccharopolyspora halophila]|uniref:Uncharacterized protein n=1 Tax=Saccharopolyspora halophila TaxID=405551 RepID=A0ABN3GDC3_9PSEU
MFTPDQIPRPSGPPASSTPLGDYLDQAPPATTASYAVLPRSLAEAMPLPWQQQMRNLLAEFHQAFGHVPWPLYQVVPSRHERLADLDDDQLAEVGCTVEVGDDGELEYRMRDGRIIEDPETHQVLVSCLDPVPQAPAAGPPPPPGW